MDLYQLEVSPWSERVRWFAAGTRGPPPTLIDYVPIFMAPLVKYKMGWNPFSQKSISVPVLFPIGAQQGLFDYEIIEYLARAGGPNSEVDLDSVFTEKETILQLIGALYDVVRTRACCHVPPAHSTSAGLADEAQGLLRTRAMYRATLSYSASVEILPFPLNWSGPVGFVASQFTSWFLLGKYKSPDEIGLSVKERHDAGFEKVRCVSMMHATEQLTR